MDDDVAKLYEWAVWAYDRLKILEEKYKQVKQTNYSLLYGKNGE